MKHKLVFDYDFGFLLFGISCHDSSYRLCWYLNRELGLQMELGKDHIVPQKKGKSQHLHYSFSISDEHSLWTLLANHSKDGMILPELKQFDYLLKIEEGEEELPSEAEVLQKIRMIPTVIGCYPLNAEQLKLKDNLILEP